jgi:hypothetical protein
VAKAENGAVPTGNVTFKLDGDTVTGSSNIALNDDGTATFALTGLTAGNHTLSVEYGGDGNYNETSATLTITVNRKTIAVPAARTGLTYNGAAQIGVSEGTGYIVSSNTATNAGSYTAIVTPDGNHQWDESTDATASRTVDFTIGKKPVTVIADNKSKYVGADDPTLTYTVSPTLVSGDTLNGSLKYTGTTVGIYDIIENRAFDNPNYAVTFVKGTMTILHTPATDEVVVKIDNLPNPVKTVVDADKVTEVTNAYNALSDTEKAQISQGDKDKLVVAQMAAGTVNGTTGNVIVSRDNLPWNVRLIVTPIDSATANFIVFSGKLTDKELLALFDLKLIDTLTGEAYELPAGQTVTVEMGGVLLNGAMNTVIAHEKPDGTIEYISATVEGTKITFKASSFSLYGVATQNTSASTSTSNSSNPGSTTNPDTYDSGTGNSDFPDTRDSSKVTLWVLLCGMALIGLVITGRRRKSGLYKMENND